MHRRIKRGTMDAPQQVGARFIAPTPVIASPPPIPYHAAPVAPRHPPRHTHNRFGFDESNPYESRARKRRAHKKTAGCATTKPARTRETGNDGDGITERVGARFIAPRTVANAPPHQTGHNAPAARRPPPRTAQTPRTAAETPMATPQTPRARRGTWTAKKPDGGDGRDAGAMNRSTSPPIGAASGSGCQSCALAFRLRPLQAA